ncbi:hypothetical protein GCM10027059_27670 [Myceligenerans halotolerans]
MSTPPPDDLIGTVGHELRSPLASVLGYAQLLRAQELTDEQREYVDVIERNGRRLLRSIDELIVGAEISAGELGMDRKGLDLGRVARDCRERLDPASRAAGVSVTVVADGPVPVRGDAELLAQVIETVLSRAITSTPRGGAVTLRASPRDGAAVIEIADTGAGMGRAELDRLTERLRRTRHAQGRQALGIGLGLPVAQAIANAHGGGLEVHSAPGEGTRVRVTLPTNSSADAGSTPRSARSSARPSSGRTE